MSDSIRDFLREEATHARSNYDRGKLVNGAKLEYALVRN